MLSNTPAAPLECDHCSGVGVIDERFACRRCAGTGHARCMGCKAHPSDAPAVRLCDGERYCVACARQFDVDLAEDQASLCKAGIDHAAAKRNEALWQTFEYVGQHSDEVETIEMRNCRCGSTLARVIATVTERQDGAGRVTYQREVAL